MLDAKYQAIKNHSNIGKYSRTFNEMMNYMPDDILSKLNSKEIAQLIDSLYKCATISKSISDQD